VFEITVTALQALQKIRGKNNLKRLVFNFKHFLKTDIDDADATFSGRVFHIRAATPGKARSLMVSRRVRRTTSDDVEED